MIYLYGMSWLNNGPCNVNKSLIDVRDEELLYVKWKNKYLRLFESIYKVARADVVVISSIWSSCKLVCRLAKFFKKKVIYLMHGYVAYEDKVNTGYHEENVIEIEKEAWEK